MTNKKAKISDELSEQMRNFCEEYVKQGSNAYQAAMTVGFTQVNARTNSYKWLERPLIKEYIQKLLAKVEKKTGITFEKKVDKLWKLVERGIPDEDIEEHKINPQISLQAISELNKMQGHHSAEKHVNVNTSLDSELEEVRKLTDDLLKSYDRDY